MRSVLKACDLEDRFPILAVENNCIVSKDADITVAFEVELPELYTVTATEYEAIHGTWVKAMKVLPNYSVVYKQDWFVKENYRSEGDGTESFLSRSYERHFNERPYLRHHCFLYLTKTTRERARRRSDFSTLCRGYILPKEITDWDSVVKFLEAVEQFERIMNDSGHVRMKRLRTEEVVGTEECPGLIERYLTLGMEDTHPVLQDICLDPERMRIGDKRLCLHVLSDTEDLPGSVGTDMRYERLSTDRSDCRLSFAAPVGLLLSCNHVYSQYVFIDDAQEILQRMEKTSRNMLSLSKYSRSNAVNYEWAEMYLDEAHTKGLVPVRCHCNVLAWAEDEEELRRIKNDTGSQLALMGCVPHYNTIDTPVLYWSGIPGNAGDFPAEESFYTFLEQAVCLFASETNYRSSPSPFGIRMTDRQSGVPLHLDISDLPMRKGIITNRNDSDPVKDLIRNSSVTNFFYSLGVEISGYLTGCSLRGESVAMACHKVRRALHLKKGQFDEKIEELVENATYGGELRIYFNAMFDRLISKDPENDFKSIRFHGNVVVAIADSRNGSGHHVRIPLDITFPFRRENLFVDSQVHYSYANEVCGMTNDWCDSTKWETGMIPFTGSVRKSRMAEYKKQEAAYEQTFRDGKCTFGDMNYKRHRDVRYSNEYPAGCRCPHCGTFWID